MTDHIQNLWNILKSQAYKAHRHPVEDAAPNCDGTLRGHALCHKAMLAQEQPWFLPGDRIGFNRYGTVEAMEWPFQAPEGWQTQDGNIVPDYETFLTRGVVSIRGQVARLLENGDADQREFAEAALISLDACLDYARRTREAAEAAGLTALADSLSRVPFGPAKTYLDACVFLKFIIFTIRMQRLNHITLGRFDRYMLPYYQADLRRGMTREALLETTEEFFISINLDTDLYPGVQRGDNGQSMVLGGRDIRGNSQFTDFSRLCMEASMELNLIDPKINLRVDKNTPLELLEFGTEMTKQGLGFPQYCNDDVVIPGLIRLGYDPEDAANYAVAACWEYISSGNGADIPNIRTMNFPAVIERVVDAHLLTSGTFEELMEQVRLGIRKECDRLTDIRCQGIFAPAYYSLFIRPCLDTGRDVTHGGGKYRNFGIHGAGIAVAADALEAIREVVFEKQEVTKEELLTALHADFEGFGSLRNRLLSCPKMGNNIDSVDGLGMELMACFSDYLNGKPNGFGGVYRAGTGSAMGYIWRAEEVGATADGRKAKQPYGSSFSPSLECRLEGPLSCIQSFTKFDLSRIINGGPLTLEIHDSTFRNDQGIQKVALLVKAFIDLGGHQLQLNSVNRDRLLDAQAHPEDHKNLIVRVWGWSGYFTELAKVYQDHIIRRTEFAV